MKSVLVIMVLLCWWRAALRDAGGEAERPDPYTRGGAEYQAVGLVAGVIGQGAEAGRPGGQRAPLSVDLDLDLAAALDRGEGAAGLVVERQVLAVLAGHPGPLV